MLYLSRDSPYFLLYSKTSDISTLVEPNITSSAISDIMLSYHAIYEDGNVVDIRLVSLEIVHKISLSVQ